MFRPLYLIYEAPVVLTEDDLLAALDGTAVSFEVKPGVALSLRPLTIPDARAYRQYRVTHPDDPEGATLMLVALCASGPGGLALTAEFVARLPVAVVGRIADEIARLNGWGDAAKNS